MDKKKIAASEKGQAAELHRPTKPSDSVLVKAERQTQKAYYDIIKNGGAGSKEATQAERVWWAARTARERGGK